MKAGRQIEFMRRYVKVVEGGGGLGVMLTLKELDSERRLRWTCGKLMNLARCWKR